MTPVIALMLILLAVVSLTYALLWRSNRREDRLWRERQNKLRSLNISRCFTNAGIILLRDDYDPAEFEWTPGAMWIVEDSAQVQIIKVPQ